MKILQTGLAGIAAALLATAAGAQDQAMLERAVEARHGLMNVHMLEAGPLFAMAKGDLAYDAAMAAEHAAALNDLTQYDETRTFIPGTSNAEMPGESRALPAIWERQQEFHEAYEALRAATARLVEVAGDGQEELAAAVGELGQSCGNCHETFRAED